MTTLSVDRYVLTEINVILQIDVYEEGSSMTNIIININNVKIIIDRK